MEIQNGEPSEDRSKSQSELPIRKTGSSHYLLLFLAVGALLLICAAGVLSGSADISKAINLGLIVLVLALGVKAGFTWVDAAVEKDPNSPTVVATRPDALEAAALVGLLEENGIRAVATGIHTSGFQVEIASEVKIVVPKCDASKALEILGAEASG